MHSGGGFYSSMQIGWQRILRASRKTFFAVPGFSRFIISTRLLPGTNRTTHVQNSDSLLANRANRADIGESLPGREGARVRFGRHQKFSKLARC